MPTRRRRKSVESDSPDASQLDQNYHWFQNGFLKQLEIHVANLGPTLDDDSSDVNRSMTAVKAVKMTLQDLGLEDEQIQQLFDEVAYDDFPIPIPSEWTEDLNKRRFELIDLEIQGELNLEQKIDLARLTRLMRQHFDTEELLGLDQIRKEHARLTDPSSGEE